MYTAEMARKGMELPNALDKRISDAVTAAVYDSYTHASIRVYIDDPFCHTIREELEKRGFFDIDVPDICLKGDVHFRW